MMADNIESLGLEELIALAISEKQGDKEFILNDYGDNDWSAGVGNPVKAVCLGESVPEISVPEWKAPKLRSPKEAMVALVRKIREAQA